MIIAFVSGLLADPGRVIGEQLLQTDSCSSPLTSNGVSLSLFLLFSLLNAVTSPMFGPPVLLHCR